MWNQLLACILEKCFALKHASHQPSNILEMKDDEQLSFHEEGSVTFQSVFNRSDQRTTHEEVTSVCLFNRLCIDINEGL